MSEIKKLIPKRRFKEFEHASDWEEREFLSIVKSIVDFRGRTPKKLGMDWSENGYLALSALNVKNGYIDFLEDVHYGSQELYDKWMTGKELYQGQVLFTTEAPMGNVTQIPDNRGFILSQRTIAFNVDKEVLTDDFLCVLLGSPRVFNDLSALSSGGTAKGVSQKSLNQLNIHIPKNKNEQNRIGKFFKKLDQTIAFQKRKLEKLKAMKSAYLSEMFPAEGECRPKRRFPEFTDDWEERELGEVAEIVRGASPRPIQETRWFDEKSEIGWLRISDVTEQNGRIRFLEQRISIKGQEKTRVLTSTHLLLSIAATVGKPVINYVQTGVHDGFLIFLNPKFNLEFMFQWLEMFRTQWQKYGQPGSQVNLNSDLVKNQKIMLPSNDEQRRISSFFILLDQTITFQQNKLEKLQNIKKAYLNEMFI